MCSCSCCCGVWWWMCEVRQSAAAPGACRHALRTAAELFVGQMCWALALCSRSWLGIIAALSTVISSYVTVQCLRAHTCRHYWHTQSILFLLHWVTDCSRGHHEDTAATLSTPNLHCVSIGTLGNICSKASNTPHAESGSRLQQVF